MCLVCQDISAIAMTVLYRLVDLPMCCMKSTNFASLYKSRGLQHVQEIYLDDSFDWTVAEIQDTGERISKRCAGNGGEVYGDTDAQTECEHDSPLARLLPKFRKDSLRVFEYDYEAKPSYKQITHLWRTQRQLTNLQLDTDLDSNPEIWKRIVNEDANTLRLLGSINRICLTIGQKADIAAFAHLIASLDYTKLEEVCLILEPRKVQMQDYSLFHYYFPSNLRRMSLVLVTLPTSEIVQLDSWPGLKELKLIDCDNIIPALLQFLSPRLTALAFRDVHRAYSCERSEERFRALISMICRFSTLETLIIDSHDAHETHQCLVESLQFLVESLQFHASTLASLMLSFIPAIEDEESEYEIDTLVYLKELGTVEISKSWIFTSLGNMQ